jgi:hypothetical protein
MTVDPTLAVDVATYVGAVAAGVSVNGLTETAKALVDKVRSRLSNAPEAPLLCVTDEFVAQVARILEGDDALYEEAAAVLGRAQVDRSIIVNAHTVTGITQTNY